MICVVIKGPTWAEIRDQLDQALQCADIAELRIDCFSEWNPAVLNEICSASTIPMIATLRSRQQGGNYLQSEEQRLDDIRQIACLEPAFLDVESHVPLSFVEEIKSRHPSMRLIRSYHDFSKTPDDLEELYQTLKQVPADFYKIAVTARDTLDALHLCVWARTTPGNVIAISMGVHGQISRIAAPIIRSPMTYASLQDDLQSAPGQLPAQVLRDRYHYHAISEKSTLFGLIGDPVGFSISDETHNALIQSIGMDAVYVKMAVKPSEIEPFLQLVRRLPFRGISVTMPLKEHLFPYLDWVDEEARAIGAVNTLLITETGISGYNTDGKGAADAIEHVSSIKGKRIVILGAGGASKAIAYESVKRHGIVTVLSRNEEKGREIAENVHCQSLSLDKMEECSEKGYDILINGTPSSMPIDASTINPGTIVMDIKTKPKDSLLLQTAARKGCHLIYGYRMFVEQAIGQFRIWLDNRIDAQACLATLEREACKALREDGIGEDTSNQP